MKRSLLYAFGALFVSCGTGSQLPRATAQLQGEIPVPDCTTLFPQNPLAPTGPAYHDLDPFNGDKNLCNDLAVYRPAESEQPQYWYWQNHATQLAGIPWGQPGDFMMPQDYNGDKFTDLAVFRPAEGTWHILESDAEGNWTNPYSDGWGEIGDEPVAADYNGDFKADLATWTRAKGRWSIKPSTPQSRSIEYALGGERDTPVADDYNGDFKADPAVYQDGTWHIILSNTGQEVVRTVRPRLLPDPPPRRRDVPVQMNYDGDTKGVDVATFDLSSGIWRIAPTSGVPYTVKFGQLGDLPAPGFYSGRTQQSGGVDNAKIPMADIAVFRAGTWYIQGHHKIPYCTYGYLEDAPATVCEFGLPGDLPIRRQLMR